jgi:hypothetical protein
VSNKNQKKIKKQNLRLMVFFHPLKNSPSARWLSHCLCLTFCGRDNEQITFSSAAFSAIFLFFRSFCGGSGVFKGKAGSISQVQILKKRTKTTVFVFIFC